MIADAIKALTELGRDTNKARIITAEKEPANLYWLQTPDGKMELREASPATRQHTANDIPTLTEFAAKFSKPDAQSAVWYNRSGIVLLVNDETRWDRVSMPLALTPQVITLQQLESTRKSFDQKNLIFLLRTTFKDCLQPAGNLVEVLRGIKWNVDSSGETAVQHGKQSVGKRIESQITGTAALPEYFSLSVPIFVGLPIRANVQLALEPDPSTQSFIVLPLPLEVESAIEAGESWIGEQLIKGLSRPVGDTLESVAPVYFGKP